MRFLDLIRLIVDNLNRRKGRVLLTAIGVTIGTASVVILVSLGSGLQKVYTSQLWGIGSLSQVQVYPNYGDSMGGGVMIGGGGGGGGGMASQMKMITPQTIRDITALEGVKDVITRDFVQVNAMVTLGKFETWGNLVGMGTNDLSMMDFKVQEGTLELESGTAIIGAPVLNGFYDPKARPGVDPGTPPNPIEVGLRLVLTKYATDGTEIKKTIPVRVVGIIAESRGESDYTIYMPIEDINKINEWGMGRRINRTKDGYQQLIVIASNASTALPISEKIKEMGYQAYTPQEYIQGINSFFMILQLVFGGVGAVALIVAAIGIANTMAMAILERTREIGLMKAVGATNRDVLSIFLGEAAGIGFIGGIVGVALGWGSCFVVNYLLVGYLSSQASANGTVPLTQVVATPIWLPILGLVFATLVGLISGLYPALRAATLLPVTALKYE
jgi:putative ABC transport system permease protein